MKNDQLGFSSYILLTHWSQVTHICVSKLTSIGSDNGLSPGRRQDITWTNDGILLIGPLATNFSEIFSKIHKFSFKKMHWKTSSAKWRPFCLGLNVLKSLTKLWFVVLFIKCFAFRLNSISSGVRPVLPLILLQNSCFCAHWHWTHESDVTKYMTYEACRVCFSVNEQS